VVSGPFVSAPAATVSATVSPARWSLAGLRRPSGRGVDGDDCRPDHAGVGRRPADHAPTADRPEAGALVATHPRDDARLRLGRKHGTVTAVETLAQAAPGPEAIAVT
jgi:hypothetical protein